MKNGDPANNIAPVLTNSKTILICTYALSGFANLASIGIQIGGISQLAPNQRAVELGSPPATATRLPGWRIHNRRWRAAQTPAPRRGFWFRRWRRNNNIGPRGENARVGARDESIGILDTINFRGRKTQCLEGILALPSIGDANVVPRPPNRIVGIGGNSRSSRIVRRAYLVLLFLWLCWHRKCKTDFDLVKVRAICRKAGAGAHQPKRIRHGIEL